MSDKPEVGFQFGVEGDQSLLATVRALREELKNVQKQQESTASSAEVLQRAWTGLIQLAGTLAIVRFAKDVFDTAVSIGKLSEITGISSKTLSVYYKAATDVGVAHEAVDKGLAKLARSFVLLQQGNKAAAAGFALVNLTAKDFIGLSPDEKLRKLTDAFAAVKNGGEKAAAAQAIFSKGGAQMILVLNELGGEKFKELADQAERMGLIFGPEFVEAARRAKVSLEDLKGTAEGMTAQFETGLLPVLADTADGVVAFAQKSASGAKQSQSSFEILGDKAAQALRGLVLVLMLVGTFFKDFGVILLQTVNLIGREIENSLTTSATVIWDLAHGKIREAHEEVLRGGKEAAQGIADAWKASAQSIQDSNERVMDYFNKAFPAVPTVRKGKDEHKGEPGDTTGAELEKGLGRAEASVLKQQSQDELALHKALTQQELEEDKRAYDQGLISLADYFDRRRGVIQQGFVEELKALGAEKAGLQGLLAKAEAESTKTPQQDLAKQAEILRLKQQIAHVDAQEAIELTKRDTELEKNEDERAKAKQDHLLKELGEQKKLADLEGDRAKSAQLAIQIEDLQIRHELEQIGRTKAEIDAFMAQYGAARSIKSGGEAAKQDFGDNLSSFEQRKAAIQERAAAGPEQGGILQYQAERELKELYREEIPLLELKVQKLRELAALAKPGSDEQKGLTKEADQDETKLIRLRTEMVKMDTTWMSWRTVALHSIDEVSTHLTTGLNGWIQGHQRFGAAIKQTWNSMVMTGVNALEKIAAQWIAHHLKMLLIKVTTNQAGVASDAVAATEGAAIESATTRKSLMHYAALAAGKAWSALAGIPVIGPILGAIAAAVTYAGVMALGGFAKGGYIGRDSGSPRTVAFAGGGQIVARSMLGGGYLRGPGSSTSDSIPAMLSDKEYVVSAKGVQAAGVETLDMINRGALNGAFLPPIRQPAPYTRNGFRMASGGLANAFASSGGGNSGPTIHMSNEVHSSSIDSKDFRDHIDDHMDYIADGLKQRMRNFRF